MSTYIRFEELAVEVSIRDGSDAITRVTGPEGKEWRSNFYPLHTADDVLDMFVQNCVYNGIEDASRLEGWGDLETGEVTMRVVRS